jgi:hypothetical protein
MSALSASAFTATPVARRALRGAKPPRARAAAVRVNAAYDSVEARRAAETERVMDRTQEIHSIEEFEAALSLAGERLVMVAVESEEECVMSDDAWAKNAGTSNLQFDDNACRTLSSSLARIAREATDVNFLRVEVLEGGRARDVAKALGVTKYPTYQYYKVRSRPSRVPPAARGASIEREPKTTPPRKPPTNKRVPTCFFLLRLGQNGELLWQHVGAGAGAQEALSEGVLYYGGAGAQGLRTTDYVTEVKSKSDLRDFIDSCSMAQPAAAGFDTGIDVPCDKQLAIVDIGVDKDAPAGCLHIFPAVLSLARNTVGFTRWARIAVDSNEETKAIAKEWGVDSVPAFVFMADGKVVDKYAGADRVELMNRVLRFQSANGIRLPQRTTPKRMSTAEAKEIARAARDRAKEQGRRSGW